MRNLLLFLLLVFSSGCKAQKDFPPDRTKAFLNWYVTKIEEPTIAERSAFLDTGMINHFPQIGLRPRDTICLSRRDSIEILNQIRLGTLTYSAKHFPGKKLLTVAEEKNILSQTGFLLYVKVSKPIFFGDRVWIYIEHFCGSHCGWGNLEVYEKSAGGYKLLKAKQIWIS